MSRKAFDILPPIIPTKKSAAPKRKTKSSGIFLFLLLLILAVIFVGQNITSKSNSSSKPSVQTQKPADFELFGNTDNKADSAPSEQIKVRVLNASGKAIDEEKIKKLFAADDIKIEQIGQATNRYEQTMVYYKKDKQDQGQKIADILKTQYAPQLQESVNLADLYDVLVIIGQK